MERLARSGLPSPRREATTLWAAVAGSGTKPGDVWLRRDQPLPPELAERFAQAVERRSSGVPFAYAVGRVGFRTLDLKLDTRALIPRPETEGLVELVLTWTRRVPRGTWHVERGGGVVADVGTGCGCIALALAVEGSFERVIAVERAAGAAALARENVALVRPDVPVEIREGDLLAPLAGERCRAIVSNPPYLTEAEYLELARAAPKTPWLEAGVAVAGRDFAAAAAIYERTGAKGAEAVARLHAAEDAATAGRRSEADAELARAQPFFEAEGAKPYLRRCEALLAAAS